jgi:hypothetical protein
MEIVPEVKSALLSALPLGTFIYSNGNMGFACRSVNDSTKARLVLFNNQAQRFEYVPTAADPTVTALIGKYVLEPDIDPTVQTAPMGITSGPELFIAEASKPRVVLFMDGAPEWYRILNMQDWTFTEPTVSADLPRILKWKFGVRLADGTPRWKLEVDAIPARNTTFTPQTA